MDTNEEITLFAQPLSPVLGSGKTKNLKSNFKSDKRKSRLRLSEKFGKVTENATVSKEVSSTLHLNSIIDNKNVEINTHNNSAEKNQKEDFNASVFTKNITVVKDLGLTEQRTLCMDNKNVKINSSPKNQLQIFNNSALGNIEPSKLSFQTASGKSLGLKKESSNFAYNLFCELIDNSQICRRENKYNFLSKKSKEQQRSEHKSVSCHSESSEYFLGFENKEYVISKKRLRSMENALSMFTMAVAPSLNTFENKPQNNQLCKKEKIDNEEISLPLKGSVYLENKHDASKSELRWEEDGLNYSLLNSFLEDFQEQIIPNNSQECKSNLEIQPHSMQSSNRQVLHSHHSVRTSAKDLQLPTDAKKLMTYPTFQKVNDGFGTNTVHAPGFSTASGKKIDISSTSLSKINQMFKDIPEINDLEKNMIDDKTPQSSIERNVCAIGSKSTTKRSIIDEDLISRSKQQNTSTNNSPMPKFNKNFVSSSAVSSPSFSTASGKRIEIPAASLSKINQIFKEIPEMNDLKTISTTSKSTMEFSNVCAIGSKQQNLTKKKLLPNPSLPKVNEIFESNDTTNSTSFSTASGKKIDIPAASLSKINQIFNNIPEIDNLGKNGFDAKTSSSTIDYSNITGNKEMKEQNVTPLRSIPKKKLGSSSLRGRKMCDQTLSRVKSLFGDLNFDDLKLPSDLQIGSSPSVSTSTPIRTRDKVPTPHLSRYSMSTPVRQVKRSLVDNNNSFLNDFPSELNCPFLIQKPTIGDLSSWTEELNRQKQIIEKKLELILGKQEALQLQANNSERENKSELILKKNNKIILKDVKRLEMQAEHHGRVENVILQINPQNATLIHFNGNWVDHATVTTEDGCILVPNQQGLIGLSEVGPAFSSMPDIRKKLIPDGWIKNHYKWIVWKLACYERYFPATLGGCFTIDNVIKQLRYRYYKELYNNERPSLRKIYEMDDIAQKRMILCISNIFKNGNSIDLELTDGWYSIRTIIDELLCHQINNKRIRIGSKLIVSGSEVLNCEGCHPLESEQAQKVRLKISFNSTRRAAWYAKLGYQKDPRPFLIKLGSANSAGGLIGGVKVYILRTYPLIYREKTASSIVWRNQNAENKKLQDFENQCFREYEEQVQDTKDRNMTKRNVCPVFQMTVIDALSDQPKPYRCTIWDSTDFHLEQLKENRIASFFSVSLRSSGEITCNKRTKFEISEETTLDYSRYKRKYVALASYDLMWSNSCFGEFDTVGIILNIRVQKENQQFWLTDPSKSLLFVNINEGPETCSLLGRISENQRVAICNLTLKKSNEQYLIAVGTRYTIVTIYPQHRFLREELEKLEKINKNDLDILTKEATLKINDFESGESLQLPSTLDGHNLNFSKATSTDLVMSMMDIDEVVNNTK